MHIPDRFSDFSIDLDSHTPFTYICVFYGANSPFESDHNPIANS